MNSWFKRFFVLAFIAVSLFSNPYGIAYGQEKKEKEKKKKPEKPPVNTITINGDTVTLKDPGQNTITYRDKDGKLVTIKVAENPASPKNATTNTNVKPSTTPLPNSPSTPGQRVFMWKAERSGDVCYLLGSIHFLQSGYYPLNTKIETAFNQSNVLAVEADISASGGLSAASTLMQQAMYKNGRTLKDNLSGETFDMVKKKLAGMNLGVNYLMKFKPWFVAMTILQYQLAKLGYSADAGVDKYFLNKARQKGMPVKELEGVSFQVNLFNSFSRQENEHFLLSTIVTTNKLHTQISKMVNAWVAGDAQTMYKNNTGYLSRYPQLLPMYKKLNDDRNVTMTQKIEGYMSSGKTYFVVVGAAHLIGPNGIVSLMRNKGYTVTQQ